MMLCAPFVAGYAIHDCGLWYLDLCFTNPYATFLAPFESTTLDGRTGAAATLAKDSVANLYLVGRQPECSTNSN
jgi:hypothetical protein